MAPGRIDAGLALCAALPALAWALLSRGGAPSLGAAAAALAALSALAAPVLAWAALARLRAAGPGAADLARLAAALALCAFWALQARRWLPILGYG